MEYEDSADRMEREVSEVMELQKKMLSPTDDATLARVREYQLKEEVRIRLTRHWEYPPRVYTDLAIAYINQGVLEPEEIMSRVLAIWRMSKEAGW